MNQHISHRGRSNTSKCRKISILSQVAKRAIYHNLDDFLKSIQVGIVNEYGERTISGRRIC